MSYPRGPYVRTSQVNELLDPPVKPVVGMGLTQYFYTDRKSWTIVQVHNYRRLTVQADRAIREDSNGMSECQAYRHEPDPDGETITISLRKDGMWAQVGQSGKGSHFVLGERHTYYDYGF